jgi:hypothetical protein
LSAITETVVILKELQNAKDAMAEELGKSEQRRVAIAQENTKVIEVRHH